jgi:glycerophosphoryl diester phosphodiesterase
MPAARRPICIAHRGASGREVENSLAAFRRAAELGADAVELDVHSTADGAFVVFHDDVIGGKPVARCPLPDLRSFRIGNGEPLPTLEEALAVILPGMRAFVELKTLDPRWDDRLIEVFDRSPAPDRIAVHAFDHRIVRRLVARRASLPAGALLSANVVNPAEVLRAAGATMLWQRWPTIDQALVDDVHAAGGLVFAWTADDPAAIRRLLEMGTDGICSNHPDRARSAIDSLPS